MCRCLSFPKCASLTFGTRRRSTNHLLHFRRCLHNYCHRQLILIHTCDSNWFALDFVQFESFSIGSTDFAGLIRGHAWHSPRIGRYPFAAVVRDHLTCANSSCSQYFAMKVRLLWVLEIFLKARLHPLLNWSHLQGVASVLIHKTRRESFLALLRCTLHRLTTQHRLPPRPHTRLHHPQCMLCVHNERVFDLQTLWNIRLLLRLNNPQQLQRNLIVQISSFGRLCASTDWSTAKVRILQFDLHMHLQIVGL